MSYSENNTYEQIIERMLANPKLAGVDKRAGSVIFDALSPCCMELAEAYAKMDVLEEQTYLMSATGENLDKRVYDYGVKRIQATTAKRIASFKKNKLDAEGNPEKDEFGKNILIDMDIPIGSRFAVPADKVEITFIYTGVVDGHKIIECEQLGTKGNSHEGTILPLQSITGLAKADIIGTYQPANDVETDNELRERTRQTINRRSFGGNIPDYIETVKNIPGAGNCKVFPAWQYNGSVLLSVVDAQYNPATEEFQKLIKKQLDPEELTGQGRGLAPIGHYVTVSAPIKKMIKVSIKLEVESGIILGTIQEEVEKQVEAYFNSVRHEFGQDKELGIYRARIISALIPEVPEILNITSVTLNDADEDIVYKDEGLIGKQYLPYVQEVVIG